MEQNSARILLITANVGSIFENLDELLDPWLEEFANKINEVKPEFIALHMQEVGGKNYKHSMQLITPFFKKFLSNQIIKAFDRYFVCVDSDFTDETNFTSLCNIYLIHENLSQNEINMYNFSEKKFFNYSSRQFFSGNLRKNEFIYKERFQKDLFKEFQWSRKGFIQTKWRIKNQNYDLVNIHLFHDPSNLIASTQTPSLYSQNRKKALEYSLLKVKQNSLLAHDELNAIFGDFNFRLDLNSLINDFSNRSDSVEIKDINNNNVLKRLICKSTNKDVFTIEEKKFIWHGESSIQNLKYDLQKYDNELSCYSEPLYELPKHFPPSYPFEEELRFPDKYMQSRCPAWCDRIILNKNLKEAIDSTISQYGMMGEKVCMGDHKPIFLFFIVKNVEFKDNSVTPVNKTSTKIKLNSDTSNNYKQKSNTIAKNYAYINYNIMNLNTPSTDIHDHAFFINLNSLKQQKYFPTYSSYQISDINLNTTSLLTPPSSQEVKNNSGSSVNNLLYLNKWFQSIVELLNLVKHSSSLTSTTSQTEFTSCPCPCNNSECILKKIDQSNFLKSYLIKFFLESLNGNLFKLKNLFCFLEETILGLSAELKQKQNNDANCSTLDVSSISLTNIDIDMLNGPLDNSLRSLLLLTEINKFLTLPCTLNLFKLAIKKSNKNMAKNNLILNDINSYFTNSNNIDLKTSTGSVSFNNSNNSNNNNEDQFKQKNNVSANLNLLAMTTMTTKNILSTSNFDQRILLAKQKVCQLDHDHDDTLKNTPLIKFTKTWKNKKRQSIK